MISVFSLVDIMEDPSNYISSGIIGGILAIIYVAYKVLKHSACRSKCCGQTTELQLDLEKGLLQNKSISPKLNDIPSATDTK